MKPLERIGHYAGLAFGVLLVAAIYVVLFSVGVWRYLRGKPLRQDE